MVSDSDDGRISMEPPALGGLVEVVVRGVPIAVANVNGALHAFESTCTHADCSLTDGTLKDLTVVCACHGGTFDLVTGAVLAGPPDGPIRIRPITRDGDQLVIGD